MKLSLSVLISLIIIQIAFLSGCGTPEDSIKATERRGDEYFQKGEYISAVREWGTLIKKGEADAWIYEKFGMAQKNLGNLPAALDAFRASTKQYPDSTGAWEKKAELEIFFHDVKAAAESLKHLEKMGRSSSYYILSGDFMCIRKKYSDAEEQYRIVLEYDPRNETALTRLAFCLLSDGRDTASMDIYKKLAAIPDKKPETLAFMSRYWYIRGNLSRAETLLREAVAAEPGNFELQVKLAGFYIDISDYTGAHAIFDLILQKNPGNIFARKMLIETSLLNGDLKSAEQELSSLSVNDKKDLEFALLSGKFSMLERNFPQAVSCFQQAIEQEPNLVVAHYLLGITYLAMGHGNLGKSELIKAVSLDRFFVDAELALAAYYYKKGIYDVAGEYASRVRDKEPDNFRAFLMSGSIYVVNGHMKKAAAMYRTAKALNPDINIPDYYAAIIAASTLPFKKIQKQYETILKLCPQCLDAAFDYAVLLSRNGRQEQAVQFLEDLSAKNPENPWPYCICGELFLKMGNEDRAISSFKKAVGVDPGIRFAYKRLISLMGGEKWRGELERILGSAIKHHSAFSDIYLTLADIYAETARQAEAIRLLEEANEKMLGNPEIENNLAWYYLMSDTRDIAKAFPLALSANEMLPDRPDIMDTLAWVYYFKGLYTQAHWLLESCLEHGADNQLVHFHLGMVYAAEGKITEARKHLLLAKKSTDMTVFPGEISRAMEKLSELEAVHAEGSAE